MIPKIIHYCWFGNHPIPANLKKCMESWKVMMPDWEWKRWDENSFDINSTPWTAEAYAARKYAFVSDYVRLLALYEFGGVYLDTDVKLEKSLEPLCYKHNAFMGFENNSVLTSAVIAMPAKHPLIASFKTYYDGKHFSQEIINSNEANVRMMTDICKRYGLICNDSEQDLIIYKNTTTEYKIHIYPQTYFCPLDFYHNKKFSKNTYAIHYFDASWLNRETKERIMFERSLWYKVIINVKVVLNKILRLFKR
ncbi:glycosyltransferase family 32 protein [Phocaeicola coprocola]|uniref:glycosyltransferase family 32 protein n=1 Tax=Phocaeicola coprocola TaxID=310298 RepID=UPI00266F9360|nr:glycosyltransferase [Phocaeicola coprocola]